MNINETHEAKYKKIKFIRRNAVFCVVYRNKGNAHKSCNIIVKTTLIMMAYST